MKVFSSIKKELRKFATTERAESNAWFFKTGKGHYGEGDLFLGVRVPDTRSIVKAHLKEVTLEDSFELLKSKYHEDRLAGVIVMTEMFKLTTTEEVKKKIFKAYLAHAHEINNWDLVDASASVIVGEYLLDKDRAVLYKLVKSKVLWERRIAVVATWAFIRKGDYQDIFALGELLLNDKHDLMHKAVGWMLREVGKNCDIQTLNIFLDKHMRTMPRTMLRYSLEHHDPAQKVRYMKR